MAQARTRGSALTVVTVSSLRAIIGLRSGDLAAAQGDAQTAIELAPDLLGAEFAGLAVAAAVLAGLDRDETPDSLRRLIDGAGVRYDTEFMPNAPLRYASGVLRAAADNHEAAIEELRSCAFEHPAHGGENPAMFPRRSAAALSLAELARHSEAQTLAAGEVQRAQSFGAARAIGIALRVQALVGAQAQRSTGLAAARSQMGRNILEARDLLVRSRQVLDRVEHEVRERELALHTNGREIPDGDANVCTARLGSHPLHHCWRKVDDVNPNAAFRKRQSEPAATDSQLERGA